MQCKCVRNAEASRYRKERIEIRGPIAKDVNLDVQIFKPKIKQNLLESIITGRKSKLNLKANLDL